MICDKEKLLSLHRYFIWANKMRTHFDEYAMKADLTQSQSQMDLMMYMSYWYGTLYTVVEGWRELNYSDSKIDSLLDSSTIELLRRYRNGVFHYQQNYSDNRFTDLYAEGKDAVVLIGELNEELGRYFLEKMKVS